MRRLRLSSDKLGCRLDQECRREEEGISGEGRYHYLPKIFTQEIKEAHVSQRASLFYKQEHVTWWTSHDCPSCIVTLGLFVWTSSPNTRTDFLKDVHKQIL
jgi:hypothetical protein